MDSEVKRRWAEIEREADTVTGDEELDSHNIGLREGYQEAVQTIDVLTGGDGEYRFCTNLDPERHCPDPVYMIRNILARHSRSDGWQPIETAPRDGNPILIWKPCERMVGEYMMAAYWSDEAGSGDPGFVPVGGYHKQGYHSQVTDTPQGYPTHWMPLPAPPQEQKGEE